MKKPIYILAFFTLWILSAYQFINLKPNLRLFPDSISYIRNDEIRAPIYPLFIDLLVSQKDQTERSQNLSPFKRVVIVQQIILAFALGLWILLMIKNKMWLAILFIFTLFSVPFIIIQDIAHCINSTILSEGLLYSLLILMVCLMYLSLTKTGIIWDILLGLTSVIALETAPRILPFLILSMIKPCLLLTKIFSRKEYPSLRQWLTGLTAPTLIIVMTTSIVGFEYHRYGVISTVPCNGFVHIGMALQFASDDDVTLFQEPTQKLFMERVLRDERLDRNHFTTDSINTNIWKIAWENYTGIFHADNRDQVAANLFFERISSTLMKDKDNATRHRQWLWEHVANGWRESPLFFRYFYYASFLLGFVLLIQKREASSIVCFIFPLISLANMIFTSSSQGWVNRYIETGHFLLIFTPTASLALLTKSQIDRLSIFTTLFKRDTNKKTSPST